MRFSAPRREGNPAAEPGFRDDDGLGIHPALARKYKKHLTPAGGLPAGGLPAGGLPAAENAEAQAPRSPADDLAADLASGLDLGDGAPTIQLSPSLVDEGAGETDEPVHLRTRAGKTRPIGPNGPSSEGVPEPEGPAAVEKPPPPSDLAPSDPELPRIRGYRLLAVVGKGAMGCVYRAVRESSQQPVAVKILAKELAARSDFVARFEREAAALKAVDHPGVVSVVDRGSEGPHHYLAMPFIEGESLRRVLGQGPLSPIRALGFARQIAQALGAAHAKKVIHRDLKPENILVQRHDDGRGAPTEKLVLVDFGLAGMGEDDPHPNLTKSRMTMGTVNYMAPEQRTDAKRVGPPADVYAAGVILYELLTGDLPLGRFKMPTARPGLAHLPKRVDECVERALDRDPEQRYTTCAEMDQALAAIERELEAQASRDTVVGRVGRGDEPSSADTEVASGEPGALRSEPGGVEEGRLGAGLGSADDGAAHDGTAPPGATPDGAPSAPGGEVGASVATRGPQWVTAPPWVKRPLLVWGSVALLVGAAIGVWTAPGDDDEASGGAAGQTPDLLALGLAFEPDRAGWSTPSGKLAWERAGPDDVEPGIIGVRAVGSELEPTLRATAVVPDEPYAWAGLGLVRGEATPVFAVRGDRTCASVIIDDGEATLTPMACAVPKAGPIDLVLECSAREKLRCFGRVGTGPALPLPAPQGEAGPGGWQAKLLCGGSRCAFERAELR